MNTEINKENILTKILQENCKKLLAEIINVFQKANINWFVACGTCLGTIRHKGFIPWDDDVDIYIAGTDYDKAKDVLKDNALLEWHDQNTKEGYPFTFPKICMKNTVIKERGVVNNNYQEGIYIDVFPLIETNKGKIRNFFSEITRFYRYSLVRQYYMDFNSGFRKLISKIVRKIHNIKKVQNKMAKSYKKHRKGKKICLDSSVFWKHAKLSLNDFKEQTFVPFDDLLLPVPSGYENYLKMYYGNYMELPPEDKRVSVHNYTYLEINGDVIYTEN